MEREEPRVDRSCYRRRSLLDTKQSRVFGKILRGRRGRREEIEIEGDQYGENLEDHQNIQRDDLGKFSPELLKKEFQVWSCVLSGINSFAVAIHIEQFEFSFIILDIQFFILILCLNFIIR